MLVGRGCGGGGFGAAAALLRRLSGGSAGQLRRLSGGSAGRLRHDKYDAADVARYQAPRSKKYDAIVLGAGHNGLVNAAYLARAGLSVLVLERRHVVGGAAVTEEIFEGFKFSRGSYLAGLLRPKIISDLELNRRGFKYLQRTPSSFTPTLEAGKYLMLGNVNVDDDLASIAQFSKNDAEAYIRYEAFLGKVRAVLQPLLDMPPPELSAQAGRRELSHTASKFFALLRTAWQHRAVLASMYELLVGPAKTILDRYFESDILKATLATDAVIGAVTSPSQLGSAYVLVHHVMGECDGREGVWAYVEGGMGAISDAVAAAAQEAGAEIVCNAQVEAILYSEQHRGDGELRAAGVVVNGQPVLAPIVSSCSTPYTTFLELESATLDAKSGGVSRRANPHPQDFLRHISHSDYSCGAMKINLAVSRLPNFTCCPSPEDGSPGPQHRGTIHFENSIAELEAAFAEASTGHPASVPVVEMTIPSALDTTLAPQGQHVVQLFVNYVPYDLHPSLLEKGGWDSPQLRSFVVDSVYRRIEQFAPGFTASILGADVLSPRDLEKVFGMHKGNFHHGALALHQLFWARPVPNFSSHRSPVPGLYMCGSGTHPGGGVQGAPGLNAARVILSDMGKTLL